MGLFFKPFFDWDGFLIWQLLVMFGVQTGCLVVALVAARSLGRGLAFVDAGGRWEGKPTSNTDSAFLDLRHPDLHRRDGFAFRGDARLATHQPGDDRLRDQHRWRVWRSLRRIDGPLGMLRLVAGLSQSGGAHLRRSDGRGRLRPGRTVHFALVQLAVVRRCHVGASPVHDDPLPDAASPGVSVFRGSQ